MYNTNKNGQSEDTRFRIYIPSWILSRFTVEGSTPKLKITDDEGKINEANLKIIMLGPGGGN